MAHNEGSASDSTHMDLLYWDAERDEPYLRIPDHSNLRIVLMSAGMEDQLVELFNHKVIGERLYSFPYPFPRSFAESLVHETLPTQQPLIDLLRSYIRTKSNTATQWLQRPDGPIHIPGCPFKIILDTSTQRIIGSVNLKRHTYQFDDDPPTIDELEAMRPEEQIWDFGYVLLPELHGKGLMTDILRAVIDGWVVPYMGIGTVGALAEFLNPASIRVLEKNGFTLQYRHMTPWPEAKGGGQRETGRYERRLL